MAGKICILRESKIFEEQSRKIADRKGLDEALNILSYAIARNPDAFPLIPGFNGIHIAKTDSYSRGGIIMPPLRLWFRKVDENMIELLSIEAYEKQND